MRKFVCILYLPLFLIANAVQASEADKLDIYDAPRALEAVPLETVEGGTVTLEASESKLRIVNLWALWCVSCRKEMPTLDMLTERYTPEEIEVLTIAVGRNAPQKVDEFFREIGVKNLPVYYDKKQKFAAEAGAAAIPHTIFLNAKGEEVARVIGEANYADEDMMAKIDSLLAAQN